MQGRAAFAAIDAFTGEQGLDAGRQSAFLRQGVQIGERRVIFAEKRSRDDLSGRQMQASFPVLFRGLKFADHATIGLDETLRINGRVEIRTDEALCRPFETRGKLPKAVLLVTIDEAYLHCAKAFMRSKLWEPGARIDRSTLPSINEMIKDQLSLDGPALPQSEIAPRYEKVLY